MARESVFIGLVGLLYPPDWRLQVTAARMERLREDAACERLTKRELKAHAYRALSMAMANFPTNLERTWDLTTFAADMMRAAMDKKAVA